MTRRVLITGASRGIGLACAQWFAEHDWQISGLARDFSATRMNFAAAYQIDLADLQNLPDALSRQIDPQAFDCLILNAGYGRFGGIEQFSHAQMRQLIDTNLTANLFLLKHFLPAFKQHGGKDIVLLGSESSLKGSKQGAVYCATKFALRGLSQSLRADCADADVRVMLVNPGPVDSSFFDQLHFAPRDGSAYALSAESVATAIGNALEQPRNCVMEEINLQPAKRAFDKR